MQIAHHLRDHAELLIVLLAEHGEVGATWWTPPERLPAYIRRELSQTKTATQNGAYNLV